MDEDNNFVLTIRDNTAMTKLEKKKQRSVKQAEEKKKQEAAEGMKF